MMAGLRREKSGEKHPTTGQSNGARRYSFLGMSGGQPNGEGGAFPRLAFDRNAASMLLNDPMHHRESKSGAFSNFFRREERGKDLAEILARNAMAGVGDHQHDGVRLCLDRDPQDAPVRHGMQSIDKEVQQNLADLIRIDLHERYCLRQFGYDANLMVCKPSMQHFETV